MAGNEHEKSTAGIPNVEGGAVAIPGTAQFTMHSRAEKREYRILLSKPTAPPPPEGYPVIYLLDANSVFGTMVEAMRVQGGRPEKTGVSPAVIVGIGYPVDTPFSPARYYDFTLPVHADELPAKPGGGEWPKTGGAESFLAFIEEELMPRIEGGLPVDSRRRTIFGHSLGGLFVLHALFARPTAFRTYIAGSPSIHWGRRPLREEERQFVSRLSGHSDADIGVLIAAGELEQEHISGMNDNARQLAERLSALASCGVRVQFKEFEGEGHVSVLPVLISRALRFQ